MYDMNNDVVDSGICEGNFVRPSDSHSTDLKVAEQEQFVGQDVARFLRRTNTKM